MNLRSLMFIAAGNLPAALYHERKSRRRSGRKIDEESVEANPLSDLNIRPYIGDLKPLGTFQPTKERLEQIIRWLYQATDAELATCKLGIVTENFGLVSWSYRTRIERQFEGCTSVMFSGKFVELPVGYRFSKIVLTTQNGDEIARRMFNQSILVTEGVAQITANYTLRFM